MVKSTQSTRRRFAQVGSGTSVCLRYRLPRTGRLPRAPKLSRTAKVRLPFLEYAKTHSVAATCDRFGIARSTFSRWQRRFDPNDLRSLEDRPSRPRRPRRSTWTRAQAEAVRRLREAHPRWGKDKLQPVLRQRGVCLSVSMVGRILTDLTRRRVIEAPVVARGTEPRTVGCGRTRATPGPTPCGNPRTTRLRSPATWSRSTQCT